MREVSTTTQQKNNESDSTSLSFPVSWIKIQVNINSMKKYVEEIFHLMARVKLIRLGAKG